MTEPNKDRDVQIPESQLEDYTIAQRRLTDLGLALAKENNIDLIVIGTRGSSGFKKLLLGSVAADTITYAHCPVMVVK